MCHRQLALQAGPGALGLVLGQRIPMLDFQTGFSLGLSLHPHSALTASCRLPFQTEQHLGVLSMFGKLRFPMEVLGAIPESSFLSVCPWIKVGSREHSLGSAVLSRFQDCTKHAGLVSFDFIIISFLIGC